MVIKYDSVQSFILALASSGVSYLILRNFENLLEKEMYVDGHGDIDILCEDGFALADAVGAYPHPGHLKNGRPDGVHYFVDIYNEKVSLDLRSPGDGYYCKPWEIAMLQSRQMFNGFYVMDKQNHFYSLIYHAILQKEIFYAAYQSRLSLMAAEQKISIENGEVSEFISALESFMKEKGYYYEMPADRHVPLKATYIKDKSLLRFDFGRYSRRKIYQTKLLIIRSLVKLKHAVTKSKRNV